MVEEDFYRLQYQRYYYYYLILILVYVIELSFTDNALAK